MKLPDLRNFDLQGKRILVRVDYDVPVKEGKVADDSRILESLPTINYLLEQKAKVILLSHLGRPEGKGVPEESLRPCVERLRELLPQVNFQFSIFNFQSNSNDQIFNEGNQVVLLENLRFNSGEENNDPEFAKELAEHGDFYINDAFAVSHRAHASVVGLPKLLPHAAGFDLLEEVKVLSGVSENPKRPVVVILGGAKADKLGVASKLVRWADKILIGGRLPLEDGCKKLENGNEDRILIAELDESSLDITKESVDKFIKEINKAGTIVWAGPLGKWEESGKEVGTEKIAQAVAECSAFRVIGGGDTEAALTKFGLVDKMDFISSGGGACLEFLAEGDLVGLNALRD